jgi:hypothetical protein
VKIDSIKTLLVNADEGKHSERPHGRNWSTAAPAAACSNPASRSRWWSCSTCCPRRLGSKSALSGGAGWLPEGSRSLPYPAARSHS